MAADFSDLKKRLDTTQRTAEYTITEVNCDPPLKITGRLANQANADYWNAIGDMAIADAVDEPEKVLRTPQERARANREKNARIDAMYRGYDRKLFPLHVFTAWSGVPGSIGGKSCLVPFSVEDAENLISALPDSVFDKMRRYFSDPANFMDRSPIPAAPIEATAKNS